MSGFGEIHRFQNAVVGHWPLPDFPPEIHVDGRRWTRTEPFTQLADYYDGRAVAGYREDIAGVGKSRHMVVFREEGDTHSFVIDHRESNPKHHPLEHALEVVADFVKRHPVGTAVVAGGGLAFLLLKAVKK